MPESDRMIHCIAFDFDGTLVDSNEIKRKSFFEVVARFTGGEKVMEGVLSDPEIGDRYAVFECFSKEMESICGHPQLNPDHLVEEYTVLCERKIAQAPEMDGLWHALPALADIGLNLLISSATPENTLRKIVAKRKFAKFFGHVFGTPETKEQHIIKMMQVFQCSAEQIVYVGDSEVDQAAAESQGCHFIGVGTDTLRFNTTPDILLPTLELLPETLEKIKQ